MLTAIKIDIIHFKLLIIMYFKLIILKNLTFINVINFELNIILMIFIFLLNIQFLNFFLQYSYLNHKFICQINHLSEII